jgi:hypothetical protein
MYSETPLVPLKVLALPTIVPVVVLTGCPASQAEIQYIRINWSIEIAHWNLPSAAAAASKTTSELRNMMINREIERINEISLSPVSYGKAPSLNPYSFCGLRWTCKMSIYD